MKKIVSKIKSLKSTNKFILFLFIYVPFALIFYWAFRDETGVFAWAYNVAYFLVGLFYLPMAFLPFIFIFISISSQRRGEGRPLSYEAMIASKNKIPQKIYKFCSLSSNKSENLNIDKLNSLKNKQIWFSSLEYLNDPFEGQFFAFPDDLENTPFPNEFKRFNIQSWEDLKTFLNNHRKQYMQCSFSQEYSNLLMWGYYTNGCRGYCVEYDVIKTDYMYPTTYVNKRPINDGILIGKKQLDIFERNRMDFQKALKKCGGSKFTDYILYLQSIKSDKWMHEKEIRLINYGLFDNKHGMNQNTEDFGIKTSKIIIGYLCEFKDELIEIANKLDVPYTIIEPSYETDSYKLIEKSQ